MHNISYQIEDLSRQFLCCLPIKQLAWSDILDNISEEDQQSLYKQTVNESVILKKPSSLEYQKAFLKHVISNLEKNCNASILQEWYASYGRLVSLPSESINYKHYKLKDYCSILSLQEDSNLISQGTTGLRTWQAALALAEYCTCNSNKFHGKTTIELGSGIGLTGLVVALFCTTKTLFLTDCHETVLNTLIQNLDNNIKNFELQIENNWSQRIRLNKTLPHKTNLQVLQLPWEEVDEQFCQELGPIDLLIAADIVYDSDLFESLSNALRCLFIYSEVQEAIIACTERNTNTLEHFKGILRAKEFIIEALSTPAQKNFFWSDESSVKIFSIKYSIK